jgi:hypothetical protein
MADDRVNGEPIKGTNASTCPGCGARFVCGIEQDVCPCWCAALPAVAPVPDPCAEARCLCPSCLERQLRSRQPAVISPLPNRAE